MVAAERLGRVQAEDRVKTAEENLAIAEAAVRDMQIHLQSLPSSVALSRSPPPATPHLASRRYLASHLPYAEFITFLAHLRALRPLREKYKDLFPAPQVSTLLGQPFLARSVVEDNDATLRLDVAPDLNYFSRSSVKNAVIAGELIIEPVSPLSLVATGIGSVSDLTCSLCGRLIFPSSLAPQSPISQFGPSPSLPSKVGSSRFSLKPFFSPSASGSSPVSSPVNSPRQSSSSFPTVYIFRVSRPPPTAASTKEEKENRSYPLCRSGWCLERLRATCELWHFVRTGIIHVVWQGDDGYLHPTESREVPDRSREPSSTSLTEGPPRRVSGSDIDEPKKRGWGGLGFAMKERTASGWKAWNARSVTSPPVSPGVAEGQPLALPADEEGPEGPLGAPIELSESKSSDPNEEITEKSTPTIPEIKEHEPSPVAATASNPAQNSAPPTDDSGTMEGAAGKGELDGEAGDTDGSEPFTTPKSDEAEIVSSSADSSHDQPATAEVAGVENGTATAVATPTKPPPIPRRAAARERASRPESAASSLEVEPNENATAAHAVSAEEDVASPEHSVPAAEPDDTPKAAVPDSTAPTAEIEPASSPAPEQPDPSASDPTPTKPPPLPRRAGPPLPPRHPRTPSTAPTVSTPQMTEDHPSSLSIAYLKEDDESWEARTWRTVVKLKEDMWCTRVGVVDS